MRVLFASDYLHVPENTGGTEINTHELCLALREVGHEPIVLAALVGRGRVGFGARIKLRLPGNPGWAEDHALGYRVLRAWTPAAILDAAITRYRPDVVVVQSWRLDMVAIARRRGCGVVLYSHSANSVYTDTIGGTWTQDCVLLANSRFNARFQGDALGGIRHHAPVDPSRTLPHHDVAHPGGAGRHQRTQRRGVVACHRPGPPRHPVHRGADLGGTAQAAGGCAD